MTLTQFMYVFANEYSHAYMYIHMHVYQCFQKHRTRRYSSYASIVH